jgi:hypothetical protein
MTEALREWRDVKSTQDRVPPNPTSGRQIQANPAGGKPLEGAGCCTVSSWPMSAKLPMESLFSFFDATTQGFANERL